MPLRLRIDFGRALLALSLAAALWIVIQNEQNPDRTDVPNFTVPVEIVKTPPGLVVVSDLPQIQVRVRGPSETWSLLRPGSFRATADASNAAPGVNELPVTVESLQHQVRSAEPIPPRVNAVMEEVDERVVPVRVNVAGNVPFGYAYSSPAITPEHVVVTGPSSAVRRVEAAVVDLRLDGVTVSLSATYAPRPVDARGGEVRAVRLTPGTVSVDVPVNQQVGYKEVGVRPVVRGQVASGYYLLPLDVDPPTVTVVGSPATLAAVNFVDTEPIDVTNVSSSVLRRAQVVPPPGLTLLQPQPVNATVRVDPLTLPQTVRVTPTIQNLGPNLQISGEVPQVDVTLAGPAPTLQSLTSRDFRVSLDLGGLRAGRHELEPRITVPPGFTLERVDPGRVSIVLRESPTPTPIRVESAAPEPTPVP